MKNLFANVKNDKKINLIQKDHLDLKRNNSYTHVMHKDFGKVLDLEEQSKIEVNSEKEIFSSRKTTNHFNKTSIFARITNILHQNSNSRNSASDFNTVGVVVKNQKSQLCILQSELMAIGFDLDLINQILKYFDVNTVELAIEYLTKTNNKWNHPFISSDFIDNDNDKTLEFSNEINYKNSKNSMEGEKFIKCLVCDDVKVLHLGYSKYKISQEKIDAEPFESSGYLKTKDLLDKIYHFKEKIYDDLVNIKDDFKMQSKFKL